MAYERWLFIEKAFCANCLGVKRVQSQIRDFDLPCQKCRLLFETDAVVVC